PVRSRCRRRPLDRGRGDRPRRAGAGDHLVADRTPAFARQRFVHRQVAVDDAQWIWRACGEERIVVAVEGGLKDSLLLVHWIAEWPVAGSREPEVRIAFRLPATGYRLPATGSFLALLNRRIHNSLRLGKNRLQMRATGEAFRVD